MRNARKLTGAARGVEIEEVTPIQRIDTTYEEWTPSLADTEPIERNLTTVWNGAMSRQGRYICSPETWRAGSETANRM